MSGRADEAGELVKIGPEVPEKLSKAAGKQAIDLDVDKQVVIAACLKIALDDDLEAADPADVVETIHDTYYADGDDTDAT